MILNKKTQPYTISRKHYLLMYYQGEMPASHIGLLTGVGGA